VLWRRWQGAINDNFVDLKAFALTLAPGTTAVITDFWDPDRYLHLALQEAGFRVDATEPVSLPCMRTAEVFLRGSQRVVHVRLHDPHVMTSVLLAPRFDTHGVPCLAAERPTRTFFLATYPSVNRRLGDDYP
jgi:hypothetical protein